MAIGEGMKKLDKGSTQDIQIAASMIAGGLLSKQGLQSIQQVLQGAKDQAAALAHVIFMAMATVRNKLASKNIDIDPKVWIAGGGVLDRVLFEVMMALHGVMNFKQASDSSFVHQVKGDILDLMQQEDDGNGDQQGDQEPQEGEQQQPQGLGAPQAPQGGPQMQGAPS